MSARYSFGKNWKSYITTLTPERIEASRHAIIESFGRSDFSGLQVLDIGSGSGLSSLAFLHMGAEVTAFDYDQDSVECTELLLKSMAPAGSKWRAIHGSVLDNKFMETLGRFDVVYSWGVLHHTGSMWHSLNSASAAVKEDGLLLIALYNDQGLASKFWKLVKRIYCSGLFGRFTVKSIFYPTFLMYSLFQDIKKLQLPMSCIRSYHRNRGMSIVHDWDDWLGGYPFETASESSVIEWSAGKSIRLVHKKITSGLGCNEFLFRALDAS